VSASSLRWLFGLYSAGLFIACLLLRTYFSLDPPTKPAVVITWWKDGVRVGRQVESQENSAVRSSSLPAGALAGEEVIVGEGPLSLQPLPFTLGLVPGRDGVKATIDDKVAYATVDDLMSAQAYDRAHLWVEASFGWGTHQATVIGILAEQLKVTPRELAERASFQRVRFERRTTGQNAGASALPRPQRPRPEHLTANDLTREIVLDGVAEAATHLALTVDGAGNFRYMVDAPSGKTLPGYNWPRHAGATFFLAQAAAALDDPNVRYACLRAAARLRDQMMRDCGSHRCISPDDPEAEIGSSALALIAFTEIARTGADGSYRPAITDLAAFLRSQQRPDGEMMHLYDRVQKKPIDKQFLYFTGEAALALARSHTVTGDPRDLDASRRALARLSGAGWSFFGSRYFFSEEHWTCQATAELWERAPDEAALAFCARWHEYQRRLQLDADETPFDAEGSFGLGPLVSPRITPASSRGEAAGALAEVFHRERVAGRLLSTANLDELSLVDRELRRAVAFVLNRQFHPGPTHLFADPVAVRGAVPGSPVDWQLRIDYVQHAGSMMLRWLEVDALAARSSGDSTQPSARPPSQH
jgi:hypothetical protein